MSQVWQVCLDCAVLEVYAVAFGLSALMPETKTNSKLRSAITSPIPLSHGDGLPMVVGEVAISQFRCDLTRFDSRFVILFVVPFATNFGRTEEKATGFLG